MIPTPAPRPAARAASPPAAWETLTLAREHYENFPVLSRFVPPALREAFAVVYAFARTTDDLGDEGEASREERLRALDAWERDLERALRDGRPTDGDGAGARHPVLAGVAELVRARGLAVEPLRDLIRANRQDQVRSRYESWAELEAYCRLSANPIGRLVLHLLDARDPALTRASDAVCTALQLANHWQGIGPDLRLRDRLYVPWEDLRAFGVLEEDLLRERPSRRVRALLGYEIDRTRELLARGAWLPQALPAGARSVVRLFVRGGAAILDETEARLDRVLLGRLRVPRRRAGLELTLEALRAWR